MKVVNNDSGSGVIVFQRPSKNSRDDFAPDGVGRVAITSVDRGVKVTHEVSWLPGDKPGEVEENVAKLIKSWLGL